MDETSTTTLSVTVKDAAMMESNVTEQLDAEEILFYNAIRADLDQLRRVPKKETIDNILNFSKGLR